MPNRFRAALVASLTIISSLMAVAPAGAAVTPQKVVIIVGPTGALTDNYRSKGDSIAEAAEAAGATAVKVYSPNATWANVKAAVNGANIVVYLGHGNGFPNPYGTTELTDRHNGWGLNRTTTNGDGDNWDETMVYCGEKALLGTLTSTSTRQWAYCGGSTNTDGITPAPNWVMIYSNACYAPGAGEGWDTPATESVALQRVRNFSYPALALGAGAYFASDMHQGSLQLVDTILRNPGMAFGAIAENANGYDLYRQRHFSHQDLTTNRIWIQNTGDATSGDYFFAYAGKPALTPSGTTVAYTEPVPPPAPAPTVVGRYPAANDTGVSALVAPAVRFDRIVSGVSASSFVLKRNGVAVAAAVYATADPQQYAMRPSAALEAGTTYTLSLSSAITSVEGGALTPVSWSFTVAGTAPSVPSVVGRYPAAGATGVSALVAPAVRFDRIVAGVSGSSFVLRRSNGTAVSAAVYVTADPQQYAMRPSAALEAGMTYTLTATSAITSLEGGALTPVSWSFTVAGTAAPPPSGTTAFSPAAQLLFKMGTHTGYKFSSSGAMTAVKSYTLLKDSGAATSLRTTIANQSGTWFYVVNGVWAGYYLRQSSNLYLASAPISATAAPNATFSPAKTLLFKMGTHTGYKFSSSGVMTAQKSYTLLRDSGASTSTHKWITNQSGTWFYVVNGVWAGYWLRASDVLFLA